MTALFLKYLLILTLLISAWESFNQTSITNKIKREAAIAFKSRDFEKASILYDSLLSYYHIDDEKIRLNLAHSYFKEENKKKAAEQYKLLTASSDAKITSVSFQQLGLIAVMKGKSNEAIVAFKKALKTDPHNEKARYNLELILKLKDQESERKQKAAQKKGKNKENGNGKKNKKGTQLKESIANKISDTGLNNSNKGDHSNNGGLSNESPEGKENQTESDEENMENHQELKNDIQGNKDTETLRTRRLSEINISEEKAKMILDEMKDEEVQYLQQQKQHLNNKDYKGKPDW